MNSITWPAVLSGMLLAAAAFGHRWLRQQRRRRDQHHQSEALQTWEGEGGALPPMAAVPRRRRVRPGQPVV